MIFAADYIETDKGLLICRCYGDGSFLEIPDMIDGKPVTALADHAMAPEESFALRKRPKKRWTAGEACLAEQTLYDGSLTPMCGEDLQEVWLPRGLQEIGDYAFYGCRGLHRVGVPSGLRKIGRGIFTAANKIRQIVLTEAGTPEQDILSQLHAPADNAQREITGVPAKASDTSPAIHRLMKALLEELPYEVEIAVRASDGAEQYRLWFPGYIEDSLENTPARIIQVTFEGMGYKYRQCFREGRLDFPCYDSLFYLTSVQELPETILHLTFDRLISGYCLEEKAKTDYLQWLKTESVLTAQYVLQDGREELLDLLCREAYFSDDLSDQFLQLAAKRHLPWAVSTLMEIRRKARAERRRASGVKKYTF